jgi:hypothetical protein
MSTRNPLSQKWPNGGIGAKSIALIARGQHESVPKLSFSTDQQYLFIVGAGYMAGSPKSGYRTTQKGRQLLESRGEQ